ncbi:SH3 domain-containing protein [Allokutzneria albata]|uniref:SH3 domain-containing protein n=1 Tax=Allokutzneria albata TaxID=211114 RepID=A0A1G9U0Q0_ALLAB|nr:hypothetical protein [Allokutzneria albata]SDM53393.1 hypothetical protein SAMN04489726_2100 [Allokutzneria albata]
MVKNFARSAAVLAATVIASGTMATVGAPPAEARACDGIAAKAHHTIWLRHTRDIDSALVVKWPAGATACRAPELIRAGSEYKVCGGKKWDRWVLLRYKGKQGWAPVVCTNVSD